MPLENYTIFNRLDELPKFSKVSGGAENLKPVFILSKNSLEEA